MWLATVVGTGILSGALQAEQINQEQEDNDDWSRATSLGELSTGSTAIVGSLSPYDDLDYFSFFVPPGAKVWIHVDTGGINVPGAADADPLVTLYYLNTNTTLTLIEEDDDDGTGNGCGSDLTNHFASAIAGVTLSGGPEKPYYILVQSYLGEIQAYTLRVAWTVDAPRTEAEPNNTPATALDLVELTSPMGLASGMIDVVGDEDYYRVSTLGGTTLMLMLDCDPDRNGGVYLAMDLLATNGASVLYSSQLDRARPGTWDAPARAFCYTVESTGSYYVRVRHGISSTAPNPYQLMALSRGPGTLLFDEASYSRSEAASNALVRILRSGGALGEVTVRFSTGDGTAVAPADYAATDQIVTFAAGVKTQYVTIPIVNDALTESNETVALTLSQPTGGAVLGAGGTSELVILDDDEVNDNSAARASSMSFSWGFAVMDLTAGGFPLAISPQLDQDWFAFTAPPGTKVWALVDTGGPQGNGATSRDSRLALFAADGMTLIEADDDDGTVSGCSPDGSQDDCEKASAIAGRTLVSGGTYYLQVTESDDNQVIDPYTLCVVLTPDVFSPEAESNDSIAAANVLLAGDRLGLVQGAIGAPGDVDWYSLTVPASSVVYISADCNPEKDLQKTDLMLDLYADGDAVPLFHADRTVSDTDRYAAEAFRYQFAEAGTYFLRVAHAHPANTGTYTLMAARYEFQVRIESIKLADADVRVEFTSQYGRQYEVERSVVMSAAPTWTPLGTVTGTGGILRYIDEGGGIGGQKFYRVRELP